MIGSGFSSVCNEDTGECDCAPNVIGERCDQCDADSYDYDDVLGCRVGALSFSYCSYYKVTIVTGSSFSDYISSWGSYIAEYSCVIMCNNES